MKGHQFSLVRNYLLNNNRQDSLYMQPASRECVCVWGGLAIQPVSLCLSKREISLCNTWSSTIPVKCYILVKCYLMPEFEVRDSGHKRSLPFAFCLVFSIVPLLSGLFLAPNILDQKYACRGLTGGSKFAFLIYHLYFCIP